MERRNCYETEKSNVCSTCRCTRNYHDGSTASGIRCKSASLDGLVGEWTFENETLENDVEGGTAASAIVTGLGNYSGTVTYTEDRNGGKAVKLGDYGLKLNQQDLGDNFTVSMWLKPDGNISDNQIIRKNGWLLQVMEITTVPPRSGQMVTDTAGRNGQIKTSVQSGTV